MVVDIVLCVLLVAAIFFMVYLSIVWWRVTLAVVGTGVIVSFVCLLQILGVIPLL